jgi:hypothetical protein
MDVADSESHRAMLKAEIHRYASRAVDLVIVEDIANWAAERKGNAKGNPPAMAVVDRETEGWGILLRRSINQAWVKSVLDGMFVRGIYDVQDRLISTELFLKHTVLHELAHLENDWGQERETDCAPWAFERLQ